MKKILILTLLISLLTNLILLFQFFNNSPIASPVSLKTNEIDNLKNLCNVHFKDLEVLKLEYFEKDHLSKDSMINFAIRYNLSNRYELSIANNTEESVVIDVNYMDAEIVNKTILTLFNISKNDLENMSSENKPIKYKNNYYYKFPDHYYEMHYFSTSSFVTKINRISTDIYEVYLTNYIVYPTAKDFVPDAPESDAPEYVLANIKSTIKYTPKNNIIQLIEYKEVPMSDYKKFLNQTTN